MIEDSAPGPRETSEGKSRGKKSALLAIAVGGLVAGTLDLLQGCILDQRRFNSANPLIVFGRVPMFYFVLHFYLIHVLAVLAAWLRYGRPAASFIFNPLPSMGGPRQLFPPDFGYDLAVVYGVWLLTVVLLYPLCRWFAQVKATRRDWWLSYL
jgi:hypothetical protein